MAAPRTPGFRNWEKTVARPMGLAGGSVGRKVLIAIATSTARPPALRNATRQELTEPIKAPAGTPITLAAVAPVNVMDSAFGTWLGGTSRTATTAASDQNPPMHTPTTSLDARTTPKVEASAVRMFAGRAGRAGAGAPSGGPACG